MDDIGDGNIYMSYKEGNRWTGIKKCRKICSRDNETHASVSPDGNTIYFTSNMSDGKGGLDIYMAKRKDNGKWDKPVNLGENINTPFDEETPYICQDGKTLYFSSEGHNSIGGFDIFYSKMDENGEWSVPLNIGYPLNTTNDDMGFVPVNNGKSGYMALIEPDGYGKKDIYKIDILQPEPEPEPEPEDKLLAITDSVQPMNQDSLAIAALKNTQQTADTLSGQELTVNNQNLDNEEISTSENNEQAEKEDEIQQAKDEIEIKGFLSLQNNRSIDNSFNITIYDQKDQELVAKIQPEINSGAFSYKVEPGIYKLEFTGDGYEKVSKTMNLDNEKNRKTASVNVEMIPLEVSSGEYLVAKSIFFNYNSCKLDRESQIELEKLNKLMEENNSLYIEITGHADSHGNFTYNQELSEQRARTVTKYMMNKGIDRNRFIVEGTGELEKLAINKNPDGSDNPEGRRFNRRVDIKLLDISTGSIITSDIHVPKNLKYKDEVTYTISLTEEEKPLPLDYFNRFQDDKVCNVWMHETVDGYLYTVGNFVNKADALQLLNDMVYKGFENARIMDNFELEDKKNKKRIADKIAKLEARKHKYTPKVK